MNIIGIDIGATKIAVCLGNDQGQIFASRKMPTGFDPQRDIENLRVLVDEMCTEHSLNLADFAAIGMGAPGALSVEKGMILDTPNMRAWWNVPIVKLAREQFDKPVFINNDANGGVLAEYLFGERRGVADMVYLTASTGMGAGIMTSGTLVQGASDTGGECGHHCLDLNGPMCSCGLRGCFEAYCGGKNLALRISRQIVDEDIKTAMTELAGDIDKIDFKVLCEAVRNRDSFALEVWDEFVLRLAQGVSNVIMMFNPKVLLLGTFAIYQGDLFMDELSSKVARFTWRIAREACEILPSTLGHRIGHLSALAIAAYHGNNGKVPHA